MASSDLGHAFDAATSSMKMYADSPPPALWQEMEKAMDAIDRNPDDIQAVKSYGAGLPAEVALGAAPEVLRRYSAEYITQARQAFEESGDPEDQQYLDDVLKRKSDFQDHVTALVKHFTLQHSMHTVTDWKSILLDRRTDVEAPRQARFIKKSHAPG